MRDRNVIFFADGSQETGSFLLKILRRRTSSPLVRSFLDQARAALQDEVQRLPSIHCHTLPDFTDLNCILQSHTHGHRHTALHSVEVVLVQLAYFIAAYEQHPEEPYPDQDNCLIAGICYGELAAAAVALASSLHELIPIAVDAVRVAFRGGILASAKGRDIEAGQLAEQSWALTISRDSGLGEAGGLNEFHYQLSIPSDKRAWISASGNSTVTLGGPPSTLDRIPEYLKQRGATTKSPRMHRLPISMPYHANHLYSPEETRRLLRQPSLLKSLSSEVCSSIRLQSIVGGYAREPVAIRSRMSLFEDVIYEVLAQPIVWDHTLSTCRDIINCDKSLSWKVRSFGPDLVAKRLAVGLQQDCSTKVDFDGHFGLLKEATDPSHRGSIAIIGMAGRFPSSNNPEELWSILKEGIDCCREIPTGRFENGNEPEEQAHGCFIDEPGLFDARFFHMSPREAIETDPAQRLAMTTTHEALESAGIVPNSTSSTRSQRIGTFWGQTSDEYKEEHSRHNIGPYHITGSSRSFGPGRINYHYKFEGPAVSLDTACSSSMTALQSACTAIWNDECDTAVVGGSNIVTGSESYEGLKSGHFLSPTGACKTFDEKADGYCRGEAVASVIIKSYEAALRDNDNILGIIRSIATNHSSSASSLTRPHAPTQEKLFRRVLQDASLEPSDIDFIEMHGTGTQTGDSVEMASVAGVFASDAKRRDIPLMLGAVKSNVGHGESASGITSLIKSLLILREQQIPPHIGVKSGMLRNKTDLAASNMEVPLDLTTRKANFAMINNFSAAGGNTALILEGCGTTGAKRRHDPRSHHIITVSAKTNGALSENTRRLLQWTQSVTDLELSDLSYSTTARRMQHPLRYSFVASSTHELERQLAQKLHVPSLIPQKKPAEMIFVFTGYTHADLTRYVELFSTSEFFMSEVSRLDETIQRLGFESIQKIFEGNSLYRPSFVQSQLAHVTGQVALYRLLRSWGIKPSLTIGHSLGEYAAMCASGILSVNDMLLVIGTRATALEREGRLHTKSMLAVRAQFENVWPKLEEAAPGLEVSCINSPTEFVVCGSNADVTLAEALLQGSDTLCQRLNLPVAFHSSQMDSVMPTLTQLNDQVTLNDPQVPMLSPLCNTKITEASQLPSGYLARQTRETVDFHSMLSTCSRRGFVADSAIWFELGPHAVCSRMVKATLGSKTNATTILGKNDNSWATISKAVAAAYDSGTEIAWKEYHRDFESGLQLLKIPTYAFDEQKYWATKPHSGTNNKGTDDGIGSVQATITMPTDFTRKTLHRMTSRANMNGFLMLSFETDLMDEELKGMIKGHVMNDVNLCSASVYNDMAYTVADYLCKHEFKAQPALGPCIANLDIQKPIMIPQTNESSQLLLRIVAHTDLHDRQTKLRFETVPSNETAPIVHAKCEINFEKMQDWQAEWKSDRLLIEREIGVLEAGLIKGSSQKLLKELTYRVFDGVVRYDQRYKSMSEIMVNGDSLSALSTYDLYTGPDSDGYTCCPYWMDGFAHVAGFVLNGLKAQDLGGAAYLSPGWQKIRMLAKIDPKKQYRVFVRIHHADKFKAFANCFILQGEDIVGKIDGLKFQLVSKTVLDKILPPNLPLTPYQFEAMASIAAQTTPEAPVQKRSPRVHRASIHVGPGCRVVDIISEETGIEKDKLLPETELTDLGIDSLLSLAILSHIRRELHVDVPSTLFEDHPTIGALEAYFGQSRPSEMASVAHYNSTVQFTPPSTQSPSVRSIVSAPVKMQALPEPAKLPSPPVDSHLSLRSIIAEQLGVDVDVISPQESLVDLGLDSLMSLQIAEAVREKLGITIDSNIFMTYDNLNDIEDVLFPPTVEEPPPPKPLVSALKRSQSLCVWLQGDPAKCTKTLFLMPDGSGSAAAYARLPMIDEHTCVYGLNSPYLKCGTDLSFEIVDLVRIWVNEIRARQPSGPYNLGGWSVGGYYAFEAAKMLTELNETVDKLICIDTPARNVYEAMPEDVLNYLATSGTMGEHGKQAPQWLVDHFLITVQAVARYKPTPMVATSALQPYMVWAADGVTRITNVHAVPGFATRVAHFFLHNKDKIQAHGWDSILPRANIRMANTTGNHFTMVFPPNAHNLSGVIEAALNDRNDQFVGVDDEF